ncbi:hypothetical protein Hdeb2414_s0003g00102681 [Helianthus debilis subsp. tardiflorus]
MFIRHMTRATNQRCFTTPYKYLNSYLRRLLNSLPLVTVVRFQSFSPVSHFMVSLNTFSIQTSPVFKCPIPGLDYVVFVKGSGPHDTQYDYQQDRPLNEVIVSRKCAEAVLRGSKVYVYGILACSAHVEKRG